MDKPNVAWRLSKLTIDGWKIPLKSGNPWNLVEDDRPQHLWGSMKNLVGNPWSMDHPKGHPSFGQLDFQASWAKSNEKPAQKSPKTNIFFVISFHHFPSVSPLQNNHPTLQPHQHLLGFNGFGWIFLFITSSLQELFTLGFQCEHRGFS